MNHDADAPRERRGLRGLRGTSTVRATGFAHAPVFAAVCAAVCAALTVAGCSLPGAAGHAPARAPEPPDVRPLAGAASFPHSEAVRLHDLQEKAIVRCMAERGLRYSSRPRTASSRGEETNPYGLLGARRASTDGYGIVGEFLHLRSSPPPRDDEPRDPAWQRALLGTAEHKVAVALPDGSRLEYSTDGCVNAARVEVYGADWNRTEPVVAALSARVLTAVEKDPGYRAAMRRWSSCMAEAGYRVAGLQAVRKRLNDRLPKVSGDPSALRALAREEIRTAEADARCQAETKLAKTVGDVQRTVEERVLGADDREVIERHLAAKRAALGKAGAGTADGKAGTGTADGKAAIGVSRGRS
ncbi:hypothetical protein [Streptomyces sp. MA5143a]|uniref:hypothetical protein n=1 Tax=Streptomyces sp. MA5143a TaxID=2083010 RepID=UPI000D2CD3C4|nr:hypothetical protein [Streptomyces sp. MA5143a]SPF03248.1 hypothetical protein SMA5143A_4017 [Streptomyces sp. MA5143a]